MEDNKAYLAGVLQGIFAKDPLYLNLSRKLEDKDAEILEKIPFDKLGDLPKIKSLIANYHQFKNISAELGKMSSLEYLDVSNNPLEAFPEELSTLTELKFLRATGIMEVEYDSYVHRLMAGPMHEATFTSPAGIKALPQNFGALRQLQYLRLESNRFTEIPKQVFELPALEYLDFASNFITHIPAEIGQLENLTYLKLSRNNFHELPDSIGNLKKLERLRLDSLDLDGLPAGIGGLESLKMLEICQAHLRSIPLEIQQLKQLEHLYLIDTEIDEIDLNALKVFLPHTRIHTNFDYLNEEDASAEDEDIA